MNLLFLTPQLPFPPRQGTAIRNWGLIHHLAERHAITLLSFCEPGQTVAAELREYCRQVVTVPVPQRTRADRLRALFSPHADLARRLWSPEFVLALTDLLSHAIFDGIQVEGLEMAPYLEYLRKPFTRGAQAPRVIYDAHNAEYVIQRRAALTDLRRPARWPAALYSLLQVPRLKTLEAATGRAVDLVTCVSAQDAAALRQLAPAVQPMIVPNGIDVAHYAGFTGKHQPDRLVFTGKMDYRPNIDAALWFVEAIWPRVRAARAEAEFFVVGQKPPERLLQLNGRQGIVVTGAVEDPRPYIAQAAVYVAPLRMGGGTRFKLLEAMALARPIVSTTLGAEGFAVRSGEHLLLADTPETFAAAVLRLLEAPSLALALGQAGLAFARAGYDWSAIVPQLEAAYSRSHSASPLTGQT